MSIKQTAGKDQLADFAPKFAQLNDEVLFGEVWSREDKLSLKMRSVVTITALISKGIVDSSLTYHLTTARKMVLRARRWLKSSPIWHFMPVGLMPGPHSVWPRRFMRTMGSRNSMAGSLGRVNRTQLIPNISLETAILNRLLIQRTHLCLLQM